MLRDEVRHLFTLHESPVRWPIALQAALAIGLPVAGFTLAGREDLGLLASSGGFTSLYLAVRSRRERAAILPLIALGLVASAVLGVLVSGSLPLTLGAMFAVAVGSSVLCLGLGVGPPGGLFFVLVAGVSSRLAAPRTLGGAAVDGWLVVAMLAIGCVIAYLVVLAPLLVPQTRRRDARLHGDRMRVHFDFDDATRVILFRIALASAIAVLVAAPLGVGRAYWVLLTVVAILQNGHRLRLTALRAVHRVVGTLVGVAVFAVLMAAGPTGLWVALALAALQFTVEIVVIRNYGLALVFITPLALTISAQASSGTLANTVTERIADTLIGAAIALVVLVIALTVRRLSARVPA